MNERSNDRFESLISAAVVDCVYQTADEFCAVDTSAVPSTPRLYKKVMRNLPGRKRTTVKVILVAALVAAFVALTACACISEIREYVWGVVTEWYGDHFEVSFEPEPVTTEEPETTASEAQYPTEIERVAKLKYVPEGCTKGEEFFVSTQYTVNYYHDVDWMFTFIQCLSDTNSYVDGENIIPISVFINGNEGFLTEEVVDNTTYYNLVWQDEEYRYTLYGSFMSVTMLIRIAENIVVE